MRPMKERSWKTSIKKPLDAIEETGLTPDEIMERRRR